MIGVPFNVGDRIVGMIGLANRPGSYTKIVNELAPIVQAVGYIIDAEQRKLQLSFIENLNEQAQAALNNHAIVSATDQFGKIIYANDNFCEISGYSREELLGNDHSLLKSGEHETEYYANVYRTLFSQEIWSGEFKNKRKDGSYYWVYSTIQKRFSKSGKFEGYIAIRTDITEQKEIARLKEMENIAKDQILSNVSHELRTPLNAVIGFAQLLKVRNDDKQNEEYIDEILYGGEQLLNSIDALLNFEKNSKYQEGSTDLMPVIDGVIDKHQEQIYEKNLDVNINVLDDPHVKISKNNLKNIIDSVISNAVKFNVQKGSIFINEHSVSDENFVLSIKDSGIGILPEEQQVIFERFKRGRIANSVYLGNGLGLSIVKELLRHAKGEVDIISDGNSGTEILLTLPIANKE
ncbi:PAS domain-containing sensor histidine kinase [Pseudemcibacter aquimaris]|uniref:PAS domain-containing sensor histidine kinase n=1 Tax=Pseudemcibacter aquimaris TaxID=2857064 RepID=UPI00201241C4|nr:PAS domain-containing sensor histidine kinase [Pseudemcibacter aquimaris]MCC3861221.1 PAS domain-containing sensor histidine kinase [Pseudemcibacter aquimaris]